MDQRTTGRQRAPMTTRGPGGGEVEHLVSVLRSAGAWLRLAADELEADGASLTRAAGFAELGRFGAERMPERIEALAAVTR